MRLIQEATELQHFFAIRNDLADATRRGMTDDIQFHLDELATMRMHTTSERLQRACKSAAADHYAIPAVISA